MRVRVMTLEGFSKDGSLDNKFRFACNAVSESCCWHAGADLLRLEQTQARKGADRCPRPLSLL